MTNYIDVPKEEVLKHITQSLIDEMNKQLAAMDDPLVKKLVVNEIEWLDDGLRFWIRDDNSE